MWGDYTNMARQPIRAQVVLQGQHVPSQAMYEVRLLGTWSQ